MAGTREELPRQINCVVDPKHPLRPVGVGWTQAPLSGILTEQINPWVSFTFAPVAGKRNSEVL